jgi:hypothetical protein
MYGLHNLQHINTTRPVCPPPDFSFFSNQNKNRRQLFLFLFLSATPPPARLMASNIANAIAKMNRADLTRQLAHFDFNKPLPNGNLPIGYALCLVCDPCAPDGMIDFFEFMVNLKKADGRTYVCDVNLMDPNIQVPLLAFALCNESPKSERCSEILLSRPDIDVNKSHGGDLETMQHYSITALCLCCAKRRARGIVQLLRDGRVDVNKSFWVGGVEATPLYYACAAGSLAIMKLLVANGATWRMNADRHTPLPNGKPTIFGAIQGNPQVKEFLETLVSSEAMVRRALEPLRVTPTRIVVHLPSKH